MREKERRERRISKGKKLGIVLAKSKLPFVAQGHTWRLQQDVVIGIGLAMKFWGHGLILIDS